MVAFSDAQLQAWLAAFLLPFFRILALFSAAPVLSLRTVPARARIGLSVVLAATIAPSVAAPVRVDPTSWAMLGFVAQEVAVGLAIGFAARLVFAAFDLAGEVIGLQMGLGFATFFDPGGGSQAAMPGAFITVVAFLVFLALDGHLVLIGGVVESFRDLPPGTLLARFDPRVLAATGATLFKLALQLAIAPLVGLLVVNFAFGLVARVSPSLNIFSVGFPATLLAGFVLLLLAAPAWVGAIEAALRSSLVALIR